MISLRTQLKDGTWEAHKALDRLPLLQELLSPHITRETYYTILKKFHGFYAAMEKQSRALIGIPRFENEIDPLIALHDMPITVLSDRPILDDVSAYVGYLYVKQGSTLGGQFIWRSLQRSLGLVPGRDQVFFYGYGDATRARWQEFEVWLESHEKTVDSEKAVATAAACFHALQRIFAA